MKNLTRILAAVVATLWLAIRIGERRSIAKTQRSIMMAAYIELEINQHGSWTGHELALTTTKRLAMMKQPAFPDSVIRRFIREQERLENIMPRDDKKVVKGQELGTHWLVTIEGRHAINQAA